MTHLIAIGIISANIWILSHHAFSQRSPA